MSDELKTIKFQLMLSPSEAEAIDDWGFKSRIRTRAEAIRRLCQIGLVFDDHRKEFVDKFQEILDSAIEMNDLSRKAAADPSSITEYEKELLLSGLNIMQAVVRMLPLVRFTTGLANNFKDDKNLEDIISEAREILGVGSTAANPKVLNGTNERVGQKVKVDVERVRQRHRDELQTSKSKPKAG